MAKTKLTVQYNAKVLQGITSPAGDPVYPLGTQSDEEVQQALDFFTENATAGMELSQFGPDQISFRDTLSEVNDILIVKYVGNVSELPELPEARDNVAEEMDDIRTSEKREIRQIIVSYESYENKEYSDVISLLKYNYGINAERVENVFSPVFKSIRDEFTPPSTSKTFVYDFKFCENQNGSIVTGSVTRRTPTRRVPTRTTSGGGGY